MSGLGPKALACLRLAAMTDGRYDTPTWDARKAAYQRVCEAFSKKAVDRKFQTLADRGYIEYGVSARWGWLTPKGRAALGVVLDNTDGAV